nr:hypothetical protein Itr_chr11CG11710 [Ipomoea trifida]
MSSPSLSLVFVQQQHNAIVTIPPPPVDSLLHTMRSSSEPATSSVWSARSGCDQKFDEQIWDDDVLGEQESNELLILFFSQVMRFLTLESVII